MLIALAIGLSALHADSESAPASGGQTRSTLRGKPAAPLIVATLDANHDGVIDAAEIRNSGVALKSLDRNADGKLTTAELRRPRPTRPAGAAPQSRPMPKRSHSEAPEAGPRN